MTIHPNNQKNTTLIAGLLALNKAGFHCSLKNPTNGNSLGKYVFKKEYDKQKVFNLFKKHMPEGDIKFDLNQ